MVFHSFFLLRTFEWFLYLRSCFENQCCDYFLQGLSFLYPFQCFISINLNILLYFLVTFFTELSTQDFNIGTVPYIKCFGWELAMFLNGIYCVQVYHDQCTRAIKFAPRIQQTLSLIFTQKHLVRVLFQNSLFHIEFCLCLYFIIFF